MASPSSRRAWIEIYRATATMSNTKSPSSRRAWIEIDKVPSVNPPYQVALLAEGVDRNPFAPPHPGGDRVALLAEGVDRNFDQIIYNVDGEMSPSSRRAWIEISSMPGCAWMVMGRPPRGGRG